MTGVRRDFAPWVVGSLLTAGVVLGGASRENDLQLVALQLLGLAVFAFAAGAIARDRIPCGNVPLAVFGAMVGILLLQLTPLPPTIWTSLPGHDGVQESLEAIGAPASWRKISLAPVETHRALLWLIPMGAMLVAAPRLTDRQRQTLSLLVLGLALASLLLGVLQIASSDGSALRLYPTTHVGLPVGFFANRNHQAILMVIAIPIAAVWAADIGRRVPDRERMLAIGALLAILLLIVGVAVTRSRAGLALLAPALLGSLAIIWRRGAFGSQSGVLLISAGVIATALAVVAQFALPAVLRRFDAMANGEARFNTWPDVIRAGREVQPWGGGAGAFDALYRSIERVELMSDSYLNHAHNDYLEIWMETGVAGAGVLTVFLLWWGSASIRAWRLPGRDRASGLQMAASLVIGLLLIHSVIDYPLRTPAMAIIFAFASTCLASARATSRIGWPHPT